MKRSIYLLACLLCLSVMGSTAQTSKMSPYTRNYITMQKKAAKGLTLRQTEANNTFVHAYIYLAEGATTDQLESLGVKVNNVFGDIVTAQIPENKLEEVSESKIVRYVQIGTPVHQLLKKARETTNVDKVHAGENPLLQSYKGKDIIVGMIDGDYDFSNPNFYKSDRSALRIKRVWDQLEESNTNSPAGYNYGSEYTTQEEMLAKRYSEDMGRAEGHGTHTTGIATGADTINGNPYYGIAPEADIVLVNVDIDNDETSDINVSDGIKYIFDYAESVGKPAVINMSLGGYSGPHDGTSTFDKIADDLQGKGRLIVAAAGNEGDTKLHLQKTFFATDNSLISFTERYENSITSDIDIWGEKDNDFSVCLIQYDTLKNQIVWTSDTLSVVKDIIGASLTINGSQKYDDMTESGIYAMASEINSNNYKGHISISYQFTADLLPNRLCGIQIMADKGTINAWSDGTDFTSYKAIGKDGDNENSVAESGGTGKRIITVGAYSTIHEEEFKNIQSIKTKMELGLLPYSFSELVGKNDDLANFSSHGPTIDGRIKPEITAPGVSIISSLPSSIVLDEAGYNASIEELPEEISDYFSDYFNDYNGYLSKTYDYIVEVNGVKYPYRAQDGTSMATPMVSGTLALWLEANPNLTPEDVKEIFKKTAITNPYMNELPNNLWGYGKIDAFAGLLNVINSTGNELIPITTTSSIYPNPVQGNCNLTLAKDDQDVTICIYKMTGEMAYNKSVGDVTAGGSISLDLQSLPQGIYVARIFGKKTDDTIKLIVK